MAGVDADNSGAGQPQDALVESPGAQSAAQSAADPPSDPLELLQAALAEAGARLAEEQDRFLRTRAEMDNIRRRAQEDVSKAHKFAIESFAEALVPVADSLEKALADSAGAPEALRSGLEITMRQLRSAFERNHLVEVNPVGEKFDPHRHQAISAVPGDGSAPANHVAAVLQKGWMISERVLRPALVIVVQGS
jgi:molecular chaperone GrpE